MDNVRRENDKWKRTLDTVRELKSAKAAAEKRLSDFEARSAAILNEIQNSEKFLNLQEIQHSLDENMDFIQAMVAREVRNLKNIDQVLAFKDEKQKIIEANSIKQKALKSKLYYLKDQNKIEADLEKIGVSLKKSKSKEAKEEQKQEESIDSNLDMKWLDETTPGPNYSSNFQRVEALVNLVEHGAKYFGQENFIEKDDRETFKWWLLKKLQGEADTPEKEVTPTPSFSLDEPDSEMFHDSEAESMTRISASSSSSSEASLVIDTQTMPNPPMVGPSLTTSNSESQTLPSQSKTETRSRSESGIAESESLINSHEMIETQFSLSQGQEQEKESFSSEKSFVCQKPTILSHSFKFVEPNSSILNDSFNDDGWQEIAENSQELPSPTQKSVKQNFETSESQEKFPEIEPPTRSQPIFETSDLTQKLRNRSQLGQMFVQESTLESQKSSKSSSFFELQPVVDDHFTIHDSTTTNHTNEVSRANHAVIEISDSTAAIGLGRSQPLLGALFIK